MGDNCGFIPLGGGERKPGWWAVISGDELLDLLHRAKDGEDPGLLVCEWYANTDGIDD